MGGNQYSSLQLNDDQPWPNGWSSFHQFYGWSMTLRTPNTSEPHGNIRKVMENPTKMDDDWGDPYFRKPPHEPY